MTYYFDEYGWLTDTPIKGRETTVTPPTVVNPNERANWTGFAWVVLPYAPPPFDSDSVIEALKTAVQAHLDATAQADDWDNIYTATLRAGYPGPFQTKGIAFAVWMDACWVKCHEVEAEVRAGQRTIPTAEELIAELPAFAG